MSPKSPIRIIKRHQRRSSDAESCVDNSTEKLQGGQEATETVREWVKTFRERPAEEPRRAFEKLFGEPASPVNSST